MFCCCCCCFPLYSGTCWDFWHDEWLQITPFQPPTRVQIPSTYTPISFICCFIMFLWNWPLYWTKDWSLAHKWLMTNLPRFSTNTKGPVGMEGIAKCWLTKALPPFWTTLPSESTILESHRRADSEGRSGRWTYDQPQKDRTCNACPHIEI